MLFRKSTYPSSIGYSIKVATTCVITCRLKKALYKLKQAPTTLYSRINGYLLAMGFIKSEVDPNLYFTLIGDDPLILVLYVDDMFLAGSEMLIEMCKHDLA